MSEESKMVYRKSGFVALAQEINSVCNEFGCFAFRSTAELQEFIDNPETYKAKYKIIIL